MTRLARVAVASLVVAGGMFGALIVLALRAPAERAAPVPRETTTTVAAPVPPPPGSVVPPVVFVTPPAPAGPRPSSPPASSTTTSMPPPPPQPTTTTTTDPPRPCPLPLIAVPGDECQPRPPLDL